MTFSDTAVSGVTAGAAAAVSVAAGAAARPLRVWRERNCGCCGAWVDHMRAAGFRVEDNLVASAAPARRMLGIPADLLSCRAAAVDDGYALDGHVPASAAPRLLAERPAGVRGLAVPGMPLGSLGMEVPGRPADSYEVIACADGAPHNVFMRFRGGREV